MKLDDTNQKILEVLQKDGSITNADLARLVGLAPASTLERVRKMEQTGIISRYVAIVDQEKVGKPVTAFVEISMASHSAETIKQFAAAAREIPEVLECHHVAGDKDFLLKVVVEDIKSYEYLAVEVIAKIPNIGRVKTDFVLSTFKSDTGIPLRPNK